VDKLSVLPYKNESDFSSNILAEVLISV